MPRQSELFDYEPLHPGRKSAEKLNPTGESESDVTDSRFQNPDSFVEREARIEAFQTNIPPRASQQRLWKLRGGHSLTFLGLFLFTFILYFRPYELSSSLVFLKTSAFWIAVLTLISFILTQSGSGEGLTIRPRELKLIFLILLCGLLSILPAIDRLVAWNSFVDYLKVVLMFTVMINAVRTERRLKALMLLGIFAGLVSAVVAFRDYSSGNLVGGDQRIVGLLGNLFSNPNDLAIHLVTMVPLVFGFFLSSRGLIKRTIAVVFEILLLSGIVLTFSRGGFIGLVAMVSVLAWRLARKYRPLIFSAAMSMILLLVIIGPSNYRTRLMSTGDDSAVARTGELKRSLYLTLRHPLLGLGMNNFPLYSNTSHATHNSYTQVASEMGLPAAAFYIMFLLAALKRLRLIQHQSRSDGTLSFWYRSVALEASLLGFMVTSFFASVAYLWYVYYLIGYVICTHRLFDMETARQAQCQK